MIRGLAGLLLAAYLLCGGGGILAAPAAPLECHIDRISPKSRTLRAACRAESRPEKTVLQFTERFAGVEGLSGRNQALKFRDERGEPIMPEILGEGRYRLRARGAFEFSYDVHLARALDPGQHALVSSLGPEAAVLMAGDLLPRLCSEDAECDAPAGFLRLRVTPPPEWELATIEKEREGVFDLPDPGHAVFFLGRLQRSTIPAVNENGMAVEIAMTGAWGFEPDAIFRLAAAIAREQAAMMGSRESGAFLVILAPFPQPMTGLRSSGVAIGRTAALMLNPDADPLRTLAHYRNHLAHEMLHFYLPNGFRIRENFDWFWEGFTRYLAVLTLTRLRLLSLREYLDAIGAEYAAYAFNPLRARVSLIDASPEKFTDAANSDLVYRKGMLLAALYDWELRWQTRNRSTAADVVGALYRNYAGGSRPVGNREVLAALAQPGNFSRLIRDDIQGVAEIEIEKRLKPYGLLVEWSAASKWKPRLSPAPKLSDRQRELIDGLGGR
ncbi:MAG: hypothetical protein ACKVX9_20185 [Blastocatellia bacterium]